MDVMTLNMSCGRCCRLLMPAAATIQVTAGSLPIASSFADISTHPPTINEITTDLVAKPGNVGVIKGVLYMLMYKNLRERSRMPRWQTL